MVRLDVSQLCIDLGGRRILDQVDLEVSSGELVGVIGPNGSGKSTLLRALSGFLQPESGEILVNGEHLSSMNRLRAAKLIAVVPQQTSMEFDFTVREIVSMGRFPYSNRWRGETQEDLLAVEKAMRATEVWDHANRLVGELSGGERQRVIIARALAQSSNLLLLDEPTSALDINHQVQIFELLEDYTRKKTLASVVALHDLNLASLFCDRVVVLSQGKVVANGKPRNVLSSRLLQKVYGSEVEVDDRSDVIRVYPVRHYARQEESL